MEYGRGIRRGWGAAAAAAAVVMIIIINFEKWNKTDFWVRSFWIVHLFIAVIRFGTAICHCTASFWAKFRSYLAGNTKTTFQLSLELGKLSFLQSHLTLDKQNTT